MLSLINGINFKLNLNKMKILNLMIAVLFLASCSQQKKEFKNVSVGMTQEEVTLNAGEPSTKKNVGPVALWVYLEADRTVVFRNDTVFNVITSANARVDSIEMGLKNAGKDLKKDLKKEAGKAVDKIDSLGKDLLKKF
jgi:outer membrane protein assembly factor BamE (lipoprotein component of BamABCDE complex)